MCTNLQLFAGDMPSAGVTSLDECYELAHEMRKIFASGEDADTVVGLRRWQDDIFTAFNIREAHVSEVIRGALSAHKKSVVAEKPRPASAPARRRTGRPTRARHSALYQFAALTCLMRRINLLPFNFGLRSRAPWRPRRALATSPQRCRSA